MNTDRIEDRFSSALDRALAGSPSGVSEDDELFELLGTAAYLRESLTPAAALEPYRTSLREWLLEAPAPPWWQHLAAPVRHRLTDRGRRPALGVAVGAGAAAIVIGVLVIRNRRSALRRVPG